MVHRWSWLQCGLQTLLHSDSTEQLISASHYCVSSYLLLWCMNGDAGVEPLLLDTQYRMHPLIAHMPSMLFYGGRLQSGLPPLYPCSLCTVVPSCKGSSEVVHDLGKLRHLRPLNLPFCFISIIIVNINKSLID